MNNDKMKNPILKVKNFGPIGENRDEKDNLVDDGFFTIEFAPVTVFIGPQASGKSTITKLYSTFAWFEKKLVRNEEYDLQEIQKKNSKEKVLTFKNFSMIKPLEKYFQNNTEIVYNGFAVCVKYSEEDFLLSWNEDKKADFVLPKLQYVPAERNVLAYANQVNQLVIGNFPEYLQWFYEEYSSALEDLVIKQDKFHLPINDFDIKFSDGCVLVQNVNSTVPMGSASSGIQSVVTVSLVSKYLIDFLSRPQNEILKKSKMVQFVEDVLKKKYSDDFQAAVLQRYKSFCDNGDSFSKEDNYSSLLKKILKSFIPRCFINIVEEPEQNLFPETQADLLYELLACKNANEHNKLIFSTHSPYLISYLTQCAKVADLKKSCNGDKQELEELRKGVEKINSKLFNAAVLGDDIKIYETNNGKVEEKKHYGKAKLPSDENFLNSHILDANDDFLRLIDLERELCQ